MKKLSNLDSQPIVVPEHILDGLRKYLKFMFRGRDAALQNAVLETYTTPPFTVGWAKDIGKRLRDDVEMDLWVTDDRYITVPQFLLDFFGEYLS